MMKTPDEIKKGLRVCDHVGRVLKVEAWCKEKCPYMDKVYGCGQDYMLADALALIQQLEAQVPRWIPVEERLPEQDTLVIVGGYGEVATGFYHEKHGLWITHAEIDFTHWMPLPEPPKEEPPC